MQQNIIVKLADLRLSDLNTTPPAGPNAADECSPLPVLYDPDADSLVLAEDASRVYAGWKAGAAAALVTVVDLPPGEAARILDDCRRARDAGVRSVRDLV